MAKIMSPEKTICRLCGSDSLYRFSKMFLQKYEVKFYHCQNCLSLESELPYWLDEAYSEERRIPDIGMATRTMQLKRMTYLASKILRFSDVDKVLDWGGGNGLLVRMMRDDGIDAYLYDLYAKNFYAIGFEYDEGCRYSVITSFETWEHFVNPAEEIEVFFESNPTYIIISTGLYESQKSDWSYLTPWSGRHIFFYSLKARQMIAQKFGYYLLNMGSFSIFSKHKLNQIQMQLLRIAFSGKKSMLLEIMFKLLDKNQSLLSSDRKLAFTRVVEFNEIDTINWP
jgi:hypothetical protein